MQMTSYSGGSITIECDSMFYSINYIQAKQYYYPLESSNAFASDKLTRLGGPAHKDQLEPDLSLILPSIVELMLFGLLVR